MSVGQCESVRKQVETGAVGSTVTTKASSVSSPSSSDMLLSSGSDLSRVLPEALLWHKGHLL